MNLAEKLTFRLENESDYRQVEELTREAFWDLFKPGCDEHLMVHQLRKTPAYIPELDLVACDGDMIIGHIIYTRSYVIDEANQKHEVISFGPISVLPQYQGRGIGSALIEQTKQMARYKGFKGIFIYGSQKYYNRFGFVNAKKFQISTPDGKNFDDFMGIELIENSLAGIKGKHFNDSAFEINKVDLEKFDKTFAFKEKLHGQS